MRLIRTQEANPGLKVARDVTDLRGNLLFRAGTELTPDLLDRLRNLNITHVFVEDASVPPSAPAPPARKSAEEISQEVDRLFAGSDAGAVMLALREAAKRYLIARNK